MARIRSLKIGFFKNEQLADLSFGHRLLFQGLWLLADKMGRLEDRPRRIKAELFPYDNVDVSAMLQDLARGDDPLIVRYVVEGNGLIWIPKFLDHQRPHHSEPASELPAYQGHTETAEKVAATGGNLGTPTLGKEGKGREGNEEGKGEEGPSPSDLQMAWNSLTAHPIPQCRELSAKRIVSANARLRERPLPEWMDVIRRIESSPFCRGQNERGWVATFDWLLQPDTSIKVLEGKYDARAPGRQRALGPDYSRPDWRDECAELHGGTCDNAFVHRAKMPDMAAS